ncbi:PilN domain-containing protein [Candidatus Riflebacteria bacterium]
MLRVNLVTQKKRKPIQIPFQAIFIVIGLCGIGAGWFMGDKFLNDQLIEMEKKKDALKEEIGSNSEFFTQKEEKEGKLASIGEQIETLKSLSGEDLRNWYEILEDLTKQVPNDTVWLTNFRVDSDNRVQISAISCDKEKKSEDKGLTKGIRKFYTRLQEHPNYSDIFLSQATEGRMENEPIMRFEVSCKVNKGKGGGVQADE